MLAPTGAAAFNVAGRAIHSALRLPVPLGESTFQPLSGDSLGSLQEAMAGVDVVIVDEMSMKGRRMLKMVDDRMRQAKARPGEYFGGASVFFCGDFGQLPPIMDLPMYATSTAKRGLSIQGLTVFRAFNRSVELTENVRQADADFQDVLWRIRCGEVSDADCSYLAQRGASRLKEDEVRGFDDAIHLMTTHEEEAAHNLRRLRELGNPVYRIDAVHRGGKKATRAPASEAGVEKTLLISKGARVMLRSNIWTSKGLTNGAQGTVVDVVASSTSSMPICVLARFPGYTGPPLFPDDPQVVPVAPLTTTFGTDKSLSRTNIPLCLCWAITIHKSQGQTYKRAVVSLGDKEHSLGLTYVAISRVVSIDGLLLIGNYSRSRLLRVNQSPKHVERGAAEKWLDGLSDRARRQTGRKKAQDQ